MNDTNRHNKPESQTVRGCAKLREDCQTKIFEKMDNNHTVQMTAIGKIDTKMAFMDGAASATRPVTNDIKRNGNGKRDWGDFGLKLLVAWVPFIAFIILLAYTISSGFSRISARSRFVSSRFARSSSDSPVNIRTCAGGLFAILSLRNDSRAVVIIGHFAEEKLWLCV